MPASAESDQKLVPLRVALLLGVAVGVPAVASPLVSGVIVAVGLVVLIAYQATRSSGLLLAAEHALHPQDGPRHAVAVAHAALADVAV